VSDLVIDANVPVKRVIEEEDTTQSACTARSGSRGTRSADRGMRKHPVEKGPPQRAFGARGGVRRRSLAGADIEPVATRPYLETAVRIALALDHPAYDCIYIALADAEGVRCVTADASLGRQVTRQGSGRYGDRVLCLADSRTVQE